MASDVCPSCGYDIAKARKIEALDAAVEGIRLFGRYDDARAFVAETCGLTHDQAGPLVVEALKKIQAACREEGLPVPKSYYEAAAEREGQPGG